MPSHRHHDMGDLYVRITVNFPSHIDPNVIGLLEQALPPRNELVMPPAPSGKKFAIDEVTLEEPNDRQRRAAQNGDEMDEDDDERGGPGVQCAQREYHLLMRRRYSFGKGRSRLAYFLASGADHRRVNDFLIRLTLYGRDVAWIPTEIPHRSSRRPDRCLRSWRNIRVDRRQMMTRHQS